MRVALSSKCLILYIIPLALDIWLATLSVVFPSQSIVQSHIQGLGGDNLLQLFIVKYYMKKDCHFTGSGKYYVYTFCQI